MTTHDEKVKDAIEKILDGDTEEASRLLAESIAAAAPDPNEIVHRIHLQKQLESFSHDYKDVMGDKNLASAVDREFAELVPKDANGNARPLQPDEFGSTLRKAGNNVRAWRDRVAGAGSSPVESDQQSRSAAIEEMAAARGQLPGRVPQ